MLCTVQTLTPGCLINFANTLYAFAKIGFRRIRGPHMKTKKGHFPRFFFSNFFRKNCLKFKSLVSCFYIFPIYCQKNVLISVYRTEGFTCGLYTPSDFVRVNLPCNMLIGSERRKEIVLIVQAYQAVFQGLDYALFSCIVKHVKCFKRQCQEIFIYIKNVNLTNPSCVSWIAV